jgi:fluoride ion exporter CrcB/FEX
MRPLSSLSSHDCTLNILFYRFSRCYQTMNNDTEQAGRISIENFNGVSTVTDGGDEIDQDQIDSKKSIPFLCFRDINSQGVLFIFLSIFAVFGSTLRMYLARIFGLDCDIPPPEHDYLAPLSTCVTATGFTEQRGGALFVDLPANMIGSFIMGIMNADNEDIATLPWLNSDHRLQNVSSIHQSIRVAFCGSLTTFASWNTQMVTMMIGTESVSGSQIVPALFGYLLGIICAISSFRFGKTTALFFHRIRYPRNKDTTSNSMDGDIDEGQIRSDETKSSSFENVGQITKWTKKKCLWIVDLLDLALHSKYSSIVCFVFLLALVFVGYSLLKDNFHKSLLICALLSPPGTILRWKLSTLNHKWKRFPLGTFTANISASIVSIICGALSSRLLLDPSAPASTWLVGIKTGFAGNLSTVSTFAKELVLLADNDNEFQSVMYAFLTVFLCCTSSMVAYALIMYT